MGGKLGGKKTPVAQTFYLELIRWRTPVCRRTCKTQLAGLAEAWFVEAAAAAACPPCWSLARCSDGWSQRADSYQVEVQTAWKQAGTSQRPTRWYFVGVAVTPTLGSYKGLPNKRWSVETGWRERTITLQHLPCSGSMMLLILICGTISVMIKNPNGVPCTSTDTQTYRNAEWKHCTGVQL